MKKAFVKKIRKIIPLSLYDIPGVEGWLEEQANAGLFPVFLGGWATFKPTGIPGTRFRLEPWGKMGTEPTKEQLELYRRAGWEYALTIGRAYFLFYATNPEAVELYSDYQSRGESLERLEKSLKRHWWVGTAVCLAFGLLLVWGLFFFQSEFDVQPEPMAGLPVAVLELCNPFFLLAMVGVFFGWRRERRDCHILEKTCRALKAGLAPPPSPGPSPALARKQKIALILSPMMAVGVIFMLLSNHGKLTVPVRELNRPYVVLQDLEQVELISDYEARRPYAIPEDENRAELHISLLAPVWYSVAQVACEAAEGDYVGYSPDPHGGTYRYTPWLDATYFRLLFPSTARPVARSQMDQHRIANLRWDYEELSYPGLDFVFWATAEPYGACYQMLALGKGNRVAVFHYGGVEQLPDHLGLLAAAVM